jgi:hypothetical protein
VKLSGAHMDSKLGPAGLGPDTVPAARGHATGNTERVA